MWKGSRERARRYTCTCKRTRRAKGRARHYTACMCAIAYFQLAFNIGAPKGCGARIQRSFLHSLMPRKSRSVHRVIGLYSSSQGCFIYCGSARPPARAWVTFRWVGRTASGLRHPCLSCENSSGTVMTAISSPATSPASTTVASICSARVSNGVPRAPTPAPSGRATRGSPAGSARSPPPGGRTTRAGAARA